MREMSSSEGECEVLCGCLHGLQFVVTLQTKFLHMLNYKAPLCTIRLLV